MLWEYKYTEEVQRGTIWSCIMLEGGALLIPTWDTWQYQDRQL